jgi:hypothetical protein
MNSLYKMFGTDKAAEKAGVWIDYGDVKFLIARAGGANIAFAEAYKAKVKPFRRQIDMGTLSKAQDDQIMAELYAESIIKSVEVKDEAGTWSKGVPTADGKVVAYSYDSVVTLLLDLPDMFADLRAMATDTTKYLRQAEEADTKNS